MKTRLALLLLAACFTLAVRASAAAPAAVTPVSALDISFLPVGAMLSWSCDAEEVAGFNVERSVDGFAFEVISRVVAEGGAAATYSYLDTERPETRVYYRITSFDRSGTSAHSALAEAPATRRPEWFLNGAYSVEPVAEFAFEIEADAVAMLACELQDFLGNPVLRHELLVQPGPNRLAVPTADLPAGAYRLEVSGGDVVEAVHFVKHAAARAAFEPLVRGH